MTVTILLASAMACLLVALVLAWMQPRHRAQTSSAGTVTIDLQCNAKDAMTELRALTDGLQRIAALAEKTGVRLAVNQMPPESDRLKPAPAPSNTNQPSLAASGSGMAGNPGSPQVETGVRFWLRRMLCRHEFKIQDIRRRTPELVECRCAKCGALGSAPYGIVLPGKLTW